jgi:GntR family transcriptional regulator
MLRTRDARDRATDADDRSRAADLPAGTASLTDGEPEIFRPQAAVALHHQIKEDVFLHLRSGRWPPGFELPSEESLCRHYGVSRGTLRRAISDLVGDGYIERQRGRGTFVSRPKLESGVVGSYSRFRVIGPPLDPGGRVLACRKVRAVKDVASMLQIESGNAIWRLERLRYTERRPVSLQTSFIPVEICPDLSRHDLRTRHLVDVLRDEYGVQLTRAVEYVEPTVADGYAARHLGVPARTPLFQIERTTYSTRDIVAEYRRALLRGDIYRYRIELR